MGNQEERLNFALDGVKTTEKKAGRDVGSTQVIVVSKTFDEDAIRPVLEAGYRIFGENRVQETQGKWPKLREEFSDVELHLIGPLQSNKTAEAVALFDVMHTVDREKIAKTLAKEFQAQGKSLKLFVQVNTGEEDQKAGIAPKQAVEFVNRCRDVHGLTIEGLMCIPPFDENPGPHFALLRKLAAEAGVKQLSMGMSADYETAVEFGATYVRVGSAVFGSR
ncbi:MAG: YggS family pyridoxal phosphate-dependent enzyme [Rhizobiaceae bacterium]